MNNNGVTTRPRLVKQPQAQQQPQPKKLGPDREFLAALVAGGGQVKVVLLDGTPLRGFIAWTDIYTIGFVGHVDGAQAPVELWLPKHSILLLQKGGNDDERL